MTADVDADTTVQRVAVAAAREGFAHALDVLYDECGGDPRLHDVRARTRALARALRSTAKRPPTPSTHLWAGALSRADRYAVFPAGYDMAQRAARDAERLLDHAEHDLRTASGEDA